MEGRSLTARASGTWPALLAGAFAIYLCFDAGGFFPGATGVAAVLLALALAGRAALGSRPLAGMGRGLGLAVAGFAAYAAWTLISATWSHAPERAIVEFDRALLYLLALVAGGLFFDTRARLTALVRVLAVATVGVCLCSLITRVAPDVWPIRPNVSNDRLSYPVTYWNGLGLLAVLATLLSVHFASAGREHPAMRVFGAAAAPVAATTLLFTFSRGAIAAGAAALVAYLVLARPRSLVSALLTALPAAAVSLVVAYDADRLATRNPVGPAAAAQGHHVALVIALACVLAAVVRAALLPLDARLARIRLRVRPSRAVVAGGLVAVVVAAIAIAAVAGGSGLVSREYHRFVRGNEVLQTGDVRTRLADPGNDNRIYHWRVALDGYRTNPLHGQGAGTYELEWAQRRPELFTVLDAHSLYLETLDELGVVGLALLVAVLLAVLAGCLKGLRRDRALYGALFAACLAWTVHAGADWDLELPAVSWWFFLLGGAALSSTRSGGVWSMPRRALRAVAVAALLLVAVTPTLVAASQTYLDAGVSAFQRGECGRAVSDSLSAMRWLSQRTEPLEILGYCDVRLGDPRLGLVAAERAVRLDPRNWRYRYDLALIRAAAGLDPRAAAREALARNPLEPLARAAVARFNANTPRVWRRAAHGAPLPMIGSV